MNEAEETALTERQCYWLEQVRACEASGKSIAEYAGKKLLVKKGILPPTHPARFQRAHLAGPVVGSEWRIKLPNGVSVAFSSSVDAATLTTVLNTAATLA